MPSLLTAVALAAALAGAQPAPASPEPPIVLVHGNSESSAFWMTCKWRLEANGYPSDRIFALDFRHPLSRSSSPASHDKLETPGRSSTEDQLKELSVAVSQALAATGSEKVVLIGHSRAGNAVRGYLWNGGDKRVAKVVLAGATVNGIANLPGGAPFNEFNRDGEFMRALNSRGTDVPVGVPTLSLRSDSADLWYQADGRFIGLPGAPIGVGPDGPKVRGGENLILAGADHKQTALSPQAFDAIYRFVTGRKPQRLDMPATKEVVLNGPVHSYAGGAPANIPVAGARVEVFEVHPATGVRKGAAAHIATTDADGRWGPSKPARTPTTSSSSRWKGSRRHTSIASPGPLRRRRTAPGRALQRRLPGADQSRRAHTGICHADLEARRWHRAADPHGNQR